MPLGNLIHNCEQTQQLSDRDMKPAIKKTNCIEKHRSKPKKRNTTFFGGFRWTFSQISCSSLYNGTVDGSNPTLLDKKTGLRFFILRFHWSAFFCKYTNDKKKLPCLINQCPTCVFLKASMHPSLSPQWPRLQMQAAI